MNLEASTSSRSTRAGSSKVVPGSQLLRQIEVAMRNDVPLWQKILLLAVAAIGIVIYLLAMFVLVGLVLFF